MALSPIHIGNGNSLTSIGEYIVAGSNVRVIDQEFLYETLKENKLTKDYIDHITAKGVNTNIWEFFRDKKIEKDLKYEREIALNVPDFNPESNNLLELGAK
ncbi:MAG: hypothetical protein L3J56_09560, partial [Bacteroidales bacterium]|nr:hypothetical protein [Bacteroidales bacterium]